MRKGSIFSISVTTCISVGGCRGWGHVEEGSAKKRDSKDGTDPKAGYLRQEIEGKDATKVSYETSHE